MAVHQTQRQARDDARRAARYALEVVADQRPGDIPSVDQAADVLAGILPPELRDALLHDACVRLVRSELTRRER